MCYDSLLSVSALCTCVTWLIHMCAMTWSHVCYDSLLCVWIHRTWVTWLIYICAMPWSHVCYDSLLFISAHCTCVACNMTNLCAWYLREHNIDTWVCVFDVTHSCLWLDSLMCVTWLIYVCKIRSCVWDGSFMRVTCLDSAKLEIFLAFCMSSLI